jgi:hypothetical protein
MIVVLIIIAIVVFALLVSRSGNYPWEDNDESWRRKLHWDDDDEIAQRHRREALSRYDRRGEG